MELVGISVLIPYYVKSISCVKISYIYIYFSFCIFRSLLMQFEHSFGWVESLYVRRSLFAICIAHCSQFEHSGDSTMQSSQCVAVHPVPKFRSCHKAIMVITGRAHCYSFCIYIYIYICVISISCVWNLNISHRRVRRKKLNRGNYSLVIIITTLTNTLCNIKPDYKFGWFLNV